jgi:hypothetical protein
MTSYLIGRLKDFNFNEEEILQKVQNLSAKEDSKDLKTGTLPESFHTTNRGCRFTYIREEWSEEGGLGENRRVKTTEGHSIVIKKSGHIFLETANCVKSVKREVHGFVQRHFAEAFAVEPVEFTGEDLRRMEGDAGNLYRLGVYPRSTGEVDEIKMIDRDEVRGKNVHSEYSDEPWAMIKVGLRRNDIDRKIGVKRSGKLTIYGKDLEAEAELEILSTVIEELRPLTNQSSYQTSIDAQSTQ